MILFIFLFIVAFFLQLDYRKAGSHCLEKGEDRRDRTAPPTSTSDLSEWVLECSLLCRLLCPQLSAWGSSPAASVWLQLPAKCQRRGRPCILPPHRSPGSCSVSASPTVSNLSPHYTSHHAAAVPRPAWCAGALAGAKASAGLTPTQKPALEASGTGGDHSGPGLLFSHTALGLEAQGGPACLC